jgi:hypothetical protein
MLASENTTNGFKNRICHWNSIDNPIGSPKKQFDLQRSKVKVTGTENVKTLKITISQKV